MLIEITLQHGCLSVNLLHIFRARFLKNTSGALLLHPSVISVKQSHNNNNTGVCTSIQWAVTHLAHAYQMSPDIDEDL